MELSAFNVIGIYLRTTNENAKASGDIAALWKRFFVENILDQIPNKIDSSIYSVYTEYEDDYTKAYTVILGCKVASLEVIPPGMMGKRILGGRFAKFTAKGNIHQGAVFSEWVNIWNTKLDRKYSADFEVYDERAKNPEDAEVDIFIGVK